ncbi:Holliday junction branch migration protein RuvA [Kamptonema cortianum]|nr:Holliday junction branch migration protein RuvA [Geitlerinema splendidum]MDK3162519.1 Holliday junction branch migration protein RuvA [Kamptonema cortianum]
MISRLRGEVIEVEGSKIVVLCHGVGYEVAVPSNLLSSHGRLGEHAEFYTRQVIREDDHTLYGFANQDQRKLFDLLREVKGCGPKFSLNLIGFLGEAGVVEAVIYGDIKALTQSPGVGPKLAERILVELKDKLATFKFESSVARAVIESHQSRPSVSDELLAALLSLGYRRSEIEETASLAREAHDNIEEQLKFALRRLAK